MIRLGSTVIPKRDDFMIYGKVRPSLGFPWKPWTEGPVTSESHKKYSPPATSNLLSRFKHRPRCQSVNRPEKSSVSNELQIAIKPPSLPLPALPIPFRRVAQQRIK